MLSLRANLSSWVLGDLVRADPPYRRDYCRPALIMVCCRLEPQRGVGRQALGDARAARWAIAVRAEAEHQDGHPLPPPGTDPPSPWPSMSLSPVQSGTCVSHNPGPRAAITAPNETAVSAAVALIG
jgi:hypothetical protein